MKTFHFTNDDDTFSFDIVCNDREGAFEIASKTHGPQVDDMFCREVMPGDRAKPLPDACYYEAGRSVSLWLHEFDETSLSYPERIAHCAKKAAAEIIKLREDIVNLSATKDVTTTEGQHD